MSRLSIIIDWYTPISVYESSFVGEPVNSSGNIEDKHAGKKCCNQTDVSGLVF